MTSRVGHSEWFAHRSELSVLMAHEHARKHIVVEEVDEADDELRRINEDNVCYKAVADGVAVSE